MSRWIRFSAVAVVAALIAFVPACSKKSGRITIGVVTNCTDPFWDLCEAGAKKAGQDFDVEVLFRQPETDGCRRADADRRVLRSAGRRSGIAVSVINPKGQTEDLTRIAGGAADHDGQRRR